MSEPHSFAPRDDYATAARPPRRRTPWVAGLVTLAVAAGVLIALVVAQDGREADDAAAQQVALVKLKQDMARRQAPHDGAAPQLRAATAASPAAQRAARKRLVAAVEAAITRDARARVQSGELDRPVRTTRCGPILKSRTAVPDDELLGRPVGRYDCVAVTSELAGGGSLGFAFVASMDFRTGDFTWCRNTPAQGERGQSLVFVRLDRRCLRTKGRALGTGYVDDGES